jgi:hypothetical protein
MIRVYLDWNVISSLKTPGFSEVMKFITENKSALLFPYSPAHFTDLMKGFSENNTLLNKDISTLEYLSSNHFLGWDSNNHKIKPSIVNVRDYFKWEKEQGSIEELLDFRKLFDEIDDSAEEYGIPKVGNLLKSILELTPINLQANSENSRMIQKAFPELNAESNMWDIAEKIGPLAQKLVKDGSFYKSLRNDIAEYGFKLEPNSSNWNIDEVLKNINNFLSTNNVEMTYSEYIKKSFEWRKEPADQFEYYNTAYLTLDLIGYKPDKLPKSSDSMQNINADGQHSFYGAHCDFFVTMDKKLGIKSKVLYKEFDVSTKVIHINELIEHISHVLDSNENNSFGFTEEILDYCNVKNIYESIPTDDERSAIHVFKLPSYYFNFFNFVLFESYPSKGITVLTFRKAYKNFSRFVYFKEIEAVVDNVLNTFGYESEDRNSKQREFVYEKVDYNFQWSIQNGIIKLEQEEDTGRPTIIFHLYRNRNTD